MNMKRIEKVILLIVLLVGILAGVSYGLWTRTLEQEENNAILAGCFELSFEGGESINLEKASPITDSRGLTMTPYKFTLKNTCTTGAKYAVNLETLADSTMNNDFVKVSIENKLDVLSSFEEVSDLEVGTKGYELITGELAGASTEGGTDGESVTYELRVWMDYDATNSEISKIFRGQIVINSAPKKVKKLLATMDYSYSSTDAVTLNYYDNGEIRLSGTGNTAGDGITATIFQYYVENNENFLNLLDQASSLSENAQGLIEMVALASFGGYNIVTEMTEGFIDFSNVTNNNELYTVALEFVENDTTNFTTADKEQLPEILKTVTTEIKPIKEIQIDEGITSIGDNFFYAFGDVEVILPKTIIEVKSYAFESSEITTVVLNEGLEQIEDDAFAGSLITSINLPSTLQSISYNAFQGSMLKSVTIPENVSVLANAFRDCSELETVIWNSVYGTAGNLFTNTPKLTSVVINSNIPYITGNSFDNKSVNPNLVLKIKMDESLKTSIKTSGDSSAAAFDFTNYNVIWGYTE